MTFKDFCYNGVCSSSEFGWSNAVLRCCRERIQLAHVRLGADGNWHQFLVHA